MRRNKCTINLDNLIYNTRQIKHHAEKKIIAVIKADAYGHGALEVANALKDEVDYLAVACFEEALELRNDGIITPILILGHTDSIKFEEAARLNITITIHDLNQLETIVVTNMLKIHLKIDTGMNRIGLNNADAVKKAISLIKENGSKI
jgi:alanine racemase